VAVRKLGTAIAATMPRNATMAKNPTITAMRIATVFVPPPAGRPAGMLVAPFVGLPQFEQSV
jgi:hypothetical protein